MENVEALVMMSEHVSLLFQLLLIHYLHNLILSINSLVSMVVFYVLATLVGGGIYISQVLKNLLFIL